MEPVIEWYGSPAEEGPLAAWDFGIVDAGAQSAVKRLFLYNNKGREGASTATGLAYTALDEAGGEDGDVVQQRWLEVRVLTHNGVAVADPDGGFKPVGGSAHPKDLSAFPLANGDYLELEVRISVPAMPPAGQRAFEHRVTYRYT